MVGTDPSGVRAQCRYCSLSFFLACDSPSCWAPLPRSATATAVGRAPIAAKASELPQKLRDMSKYSCWGVFMREQLYFARTLWIVVCLFPEAASSENLITCGSGRNDVRSSSLASRLRALWTGWREAVHLSPIPSNQQLGTRDLWKVRRPLETPNPRGELVLIYRLLVIFDETKELGS